MTRAEVIDMLTDLRTAYPAFCRDMGKDELERVVRLWQAHFAQTDGRIAMTAVHALIDADVRGFAPTIGAVKDQVRRLLGDDQTAVEAWSTVRAAAADGLYNAERRFRALSPLLQRLVGSPAQLTRWAMMDETELDTVIGSTFQRSYLAALADERSRAVMSPELAIYADKLRKELTGSQEAALTEAAR